MTPLFNQLNNQLGIVLAHAELIEARAVTESERARAAQIVASALDAMLTVRVLREQRDHAPPRSANESPIVWQEIPPFVNTLTN